MDSIIVTVTDEKNSFYIDLEVPENLPAGKLREDMIETLNGFQPELFLSAFQTVLICARSGKVIQEDETLRDAGVWNGDYLGVFPSDCSYS